MRRLASLILVLGACDAVFRFNDVPLPPDAKLPEPDASCSFSKLIDTCALGDPSGWQNDIELTDDAGAEVFMKIDNVDLGSTTLHVVKVKKLGQLGGTTLTLAGNKPFVIVSDGDITFEGTVRANAGDRSPGECGLSTGAIGSPDSGGAGGGGGGALGADGGGGGRGDMDGSPAGGTLGGAAGVASAWSGGALLGGCPGGPGGTSTGATTIMGGAGGVGGGALALISRTAIHIDASAIVTAPGFPGEGGLGSAGYATGGGGGGAGGMIWIEAPEITIDGVIAANGGGGGEGGATGGAGATGAQGTTADAPAAGGAGNLSGGGDGGSGAHAGHLAGYDATQWLNGAGGGGGGSVGIIVLVSPTPAPFAGVTTPKPTPAP